MKFTEAMETFIDIKDEIESCVLMSSDNKDVRESKKLHLQAEYDEAARVLDSFVLPVEFEGE